MKTDFTTTAKQMASKLSDLEKRQIPWASVLTLNETRDRCKDAVLTEMVRKIDKPTPFTMNALRVENASKSKLESALIVKDIQAEYLETLLEDGGTEVDKHIVPGKQAKLNAYGNLPRGASKQRATFSHGNRRYKRVGKGKSARVFLLGHFPSKRTYRRLIDFHGVCEATAKRNFDQIFRKNLRRAMATAR